MRLPVAGTATLVVTPALDARPLPAVVAFGAPSSLSIRIFKIMRRHDPARADAIFAHETTFRPEGSVILSGRRVTRYRGWIPTAATERAIVEVPTESNRAAYEVRLAPGAETRLDLSR